MSLVKLHNIYLIEKIQQPQSLLYTLIMWDTSIILGQYPSDLKKKTYQGTGFRQLSYWFLIVVTFFKKGISTSSRFSQGIGSKVDYQSWIIGQKFWEIYFMEKIYFCLRNNGVPVKAVRKVGSKYKKQRLHTLKNQ